MIEDFILMFSVGLWLFETICLFRLVCAIRDIRDWLDSFSEDMIDSLDSLESSIYSLKDN